MRTGFASRRYFLAGAGAACCIGPKAAAAQALDHLTIGLLPFDACTPTLVGVRSGIFRRYGLNVDVQRVSSGSAAAAAVVGGALQLGAANLMSLITAHTKGIAFQIVAPENVYRTEQPTEVLVVRKDGAIRSAADLNGKTIASPGLGDLLSAATLVWIDQNGGDSKTVHQIEIPPAATPAALESGRIDAAVIVEPFLSDVRRAGIARVLGNVYDVIGKRFLAGALFGMADYINANRDVIQRFARAQLEANIFANAHQDQTAGWLAEFAHVDKDTILQSARPSFDESIVTVDVQRLIDAAARFKLIAQAFDAREIISPVVR